MSVLPPTTPDPHADPLLASAVRAAAERASADCPDAEVLGLYAERELQGAERQAVETHVAGCGRCQAIVAAFIQSAPEADVAPGVVPSPVAAATAWWRGWRWMVPLASATAVLAIAVWVGRTPADEAARQQISKADAAGSTAPAPEPASGGTPAPSAVSPEAKAAAAALTGAAGAAGQSRPAESGAEVRKELQQRLAEAVTSTPPAGAGAGATAGAPPPAAPAVVGQTAQATATAEERARAAAPAAAPAAPPAAAADAAGPARANAMSAAKAASPAATLVGTVRTRTGAPLPAGAVVEVRLLDVSRADAPAATIARLEAEAGTDTAAVPFTLPYDHAAITAGRRYVVQVTVSTGGRVIWRTTTQHPVLADGTPGPTPLTLLVDPVR